MSRSPSFNPKHYRFAPETFMGERFTLTVYAAIKVILKTAQTVYIYTLEYIT
jgi:hypothetical protein